jgi:hypothetical protein
LLHGNTIESITAYNGIDLMATAGYVKEIKQMIDDRSPDLLLAENIGIDDTGLGGGVTDRLREDGLGVTAVNFGGKAREDHFYDTRSEMAVLLAEEIRGSKIKLLDDELLKAQLADLRTEMTSRGRKLESKDKIKRRRGRSPDRSDSLMIANYMRTRGQYAPMVAMVEC